MEAQEKTATAAPTITDYFRFAIGQDFSLTVQVSTVAVLVLVGIVILFAVIRHYVIRDDLTDFEIDEAEFGLGDQKVTFRANNLDRAVAYRIWVELSTRKIGLPIDPNDDVIDEIYNSWYEFFSITRELIKDVPVGKVRKDSTQKIIYLSIDLLNSGLRPHLTKWQARFRRWYAYQLQKDKEAALHPQEIQKQFPDYDELVADMLAINRRLIIYRDRMNALVVGQHGSRSNGLDEKR